MVIFFSSFLITINPLFFNVSTTNISLLTTSNALQLILQIIGNLGKTVLLDNDVVKMYDMLLKVHDDTVITPPTTNIIKKATKNYKGELIRKKEDIVESNIIREGTRERKKIDKLNL